MSESDGREGSVLMGLDACLPALNSLPRPGSGATLSRWAEFARLGRVDLSVTRLCEGHADAVAILYELNRRDLLDRVGPTGRLGVWAAEPDRLEARPTSTGWTLSGKKGWCSGSQALAAALITATTAHGPRLFLVEPDDAAIAVECGSWEPLGMRPTRSETLNFHDLEIHADAAVGDVGAYVDRAGFGHGGAGVAACWWGGAAGVVDALRDGVAAGDEEVAAAYGTATADLEAAWSCLADGAAAIDRHPVDLELAVRIAGRARLVVEAAAQRALRLTIAALGAAGLCHRPDHSRRIADLTVYVSQLRRRSAAISYGRLAGEEFGPFR